ncbi:hypothetical protein [Candidiatus Paracoxiella cheracis]|uniref:hypothetical protein n=1 Tax=Candidiatus Paracoxiella cheracis TaxID=3405120 RepID=UPI003BF5B4DB
MSRDNHFGNEPLSDYYYYIEAFASYLNSFHQAHWDLQSKSKFVSIQACRDARDRLLPSLSIIDSQYATT